MLSHASSVVAGSPACVDNEPVPWIPVPAGSDPNFFRALIPYFEVATYQAGDEIITQGSRGDKLYFLYRGSAVVVIDGAQVAIVNSGSFIGEMALLGQPKRTATVQALEFCDCRFISRHAFQLMTARYPQERAHFVEMMKDRQRRNSASLTLQPFMHGEERRSTGQSEGQHPVDNESNMNPWPFLPTWLLSQYTISPPVSPKQPINSFGRRPPGRSPKIAASSLGRALVVPTRPSRSLSIEENERRPSSPIDPTSPRSSMFVLQEEEKGLHSFKNKHRAMTQNIRSRLEDQGEPQRRNSAPCENLSRSSQMEAPSIVSEGARSCAPLVLICPPRTSPMLRQRLEDPLKATNEHIGARNDKDKEPECLNSQLVESPPCTSRRERVSMVSGVAGSVPSILLTSRRQRLSPPQAEEKLPSLKDQRPSEKTTTRIDNQWEQEGPTSPTSESWPSSARSTRSYVASEVAPCLAPIIPSSPPLPKLKVKFMEAD